MKDIEAEAIENYEKNMHYLLETHPKLYKDLLDFDKLIAEHSYKEQYHLEYINNCFNIMQEKSQTYLYGEDSVGISKSIAKSINYKKDDNTLETFSVIKTDEKTFSGKDGERDFKIREFIYPFMNYYLNNTNPNDEMKKIEKFIFLGIGLGLHIPMIHQKINASKYFIIEDNIELFKLSLFTTKYYELAKESKLFFSILDDTLSFTANFGNFLVQDYLYNYKIKFLHLATHSDLKLKYLTSVLTQQSFALYPYKAQIYSILAPLHYIKQKYNFLDIYSMSNQKVFHNKPVLVVAAGPSLSQNILWLQENHTKFVIIAVAAVIVYLQKNGISPDIITTLDSAQSVYDEISSYKNEGASVICAAQTHEGVVKFFDKENTYIIEIASSYFQNRINFQSTCVGSFSYLFSVNLHIKEIYLLGLDLAINQETGDDHISDHDFNTTLDIENKKIFNPQVSISSSLIPLEGNKQETIYTTPMLQRSINAIGSFVEGILSEHTTIYNLSNGAKLKGSINLDINSIDIKDLKKINKKELRNNINLYFKEKSSLYLPQESINDIKIRYAFIQKIKSIINNYSNSVSHSNYATYNLAFLELQHAITHEHNLNVNDIVQVYASYFQYTLTLIEDFFNTKNLKNTKKHIKKLDKMLQEGLLDIVSEFEEKFEEYI